MLLPIKWLKNYVDIKEDSRSIADRLTMSGSHVESIISRKREIENVVVARINSMEKHENADKLLVCKLDIGREVLQIVTAATNLKEGDYVALAIIGAVLPGDLKIEKTDFRGIDSYGMLCSLNELGFGDNVIAKKMKDGIFILDKAYPLGSSIIDVMGLDEDVIEIEITPNRPDCLSIIGMARETAATFGLSLKEPKIEIKNEVEDIKDYLNDIKINSSNCNRYFARVVKDVEIKESPLWIQTKLMQAGIRPINNIVDITNYVMLEYGEPLHAFDLDKIEGREIIVRQANEGEKIKTLDEIDRELSTRDLVIADSNKAIAIAGVMGGYDTEVSKETKNILLEGANFNAKSIRLTSKKFNLRSEASSRFEKGIDLNLSELAVNRVCQLIEETNSASIVKGEIDVYEDVSKEKTIHLKPENANRILGIDITSEKMLEYLNSLGLKSILEDNIIKTIVPTFRLDLDIEVDLIEEIGRMYGFHNIESKPLIGVLTRGEKPYARKIEDKVKSILTALGINEVMTYSFISPKAYDKINIAEDSKLREYIELMNPLGEDYSVMRTTLIANMLELLSRNYNRGVEECYLYEIGNIFIANEIPVSTLPNEKKILSIGFYGHKDFYYLKDVINKTLDRLGIKDIEYIREENNNSFHPGKTAKILLKGEELGVIGEVHPEVVENYNIGKRVYLCNLDFQKIIENTKLDKEFKELPKYPSVQRDIAILIDRDILVGEIEKTILKHGEGLIEEVKLFDIYTGDRIPESKKNVAYSIIYRSMDRTLRDEEVNSIQDAIIEDLTNTFKAELRS